MEFRIQDLYINMETVKLQSSIESLLFASGSPVKKSKLAKICGVESARLEEGLATLAQKYAQDESGLLLISKGEEVQLVTRAENAQLVEQLVKNELADSLSAAALEVLSVIAYRGPVSKPEIEAIRGVNCNYTVRSLLMRGLIVRLDNPNDSRGYVYEISFDFLKKLGLESVEKLPQYDILSKDMRVQEVINKE